MGIQSIVSYEQRVETPITSFHTFPPESSEFQSRFESMNNDSNDNDNIMPVS